MTRLRVTATMQRALDDLHQSKGIHRQVGTMLVPQMLDIASWEAIAIPSQRQLLVDVRDGPNAVVASPELRDPSDRTAAYKDTMPPNVDSTPVEQKVNAAREQYANAMAAYG